MSQQSKFGAAVGRPGPKQPAQGRSSLGPRPRRASAPVLVAPRATRRAAAAHTAGFPRAVCSWLVLAADIAHHLHWRGPAPRVRPAGSAAGSVILRPLPLLGGPRSFAMPPRRRRARRAGVPRGRFRRLRRCRSCCLRRAAIFRRCATICCRLLRQRPHLRDLGPHLRELGLRGGVLTLR